MILFSVILLGVMVLECVVSLVDVGWNGGGVPEMFVNRCGRLFARCGMVVWFVLLLGCTRLCLVFGLGW